MSLSDGNGTPVPGTIHAVEKSGTIPSAAEGDLARAQELLKLAGNGSRKNKVLGAALVLLLGSGGIVASYFATEALAKRNAEDIDDHGAKGMHDGAAEQLDELDEKIDDLEGDVEDIAKTQGIIVEGIESLKREKVEDLKKELEAERRRNRRRERDRR